LDFSLFDDVILSSQIGLIKPYPEIYQYAVDKWKINAKESIFIDDREINLKQFEKLGGKTFLFDKFNTSKSVEFLYKKIKNEK
jgi:putative hydrolase of the HAD superfamily